jgi:hypothetical protein
MSNVQDTTSVRFSTPSVLLSSKKQVASRSVPKKQVSKKQVSKKQVSKKQVSEKQVASRSVPKKQVPKKQVSEKQVASRSVPKKQVTFDNVPEVCVPNTYPIVPPKETFGASNLDTVVELVKKEPEAYLTPYEKEVIVPILENLIPESAPLWIVARRTILIHIKKGYKIFMYVMNTGSIVLCGCIGSTIHIVHCSAHIAPILNIIEQFRPRKAQKSYLTELLKVLFRHVKLDSIRQFLFEGITFPVLNASDEYLDARRKDPGVCCDLAFHLRHGMQSMTQYSSAWSNRSVTFGGLRKVKFVPK